MANRWLRGPQLNTNAGQTERDFMVKIYALWLYYVMDFTFQTQVVASGKSFISVEKTGGANKGSFSGSDFIFTVSSGPFELSDLRKMIIIRDQAVDRNGGVYRITRYLSATQVMINYHAGTLEYPAASTGVDWWICGTGFETPPCTGSPRNYVRFQSRHTSGWAIELTCNATGGGYGPYMNVRLAPDGNWSSKIVGYSTGTGSLADYNYDTGFNVSHSNQGYTWTMWAVADYTSCEWMCLWKCDHFNSNAYLDLSTMSTVLIGYLDYYDTGHPDYERLVLYGGGAGYGFNMENGVRTAHGNQGRGFVWCDLRGGRTYCYMMQPSYYGNAQGFSRQTARQRNPRLGGAYGRWEWFEGTPMINDDYNNSSGSFQLLGVLKGHRTLPVFGNNGTPNTRLDAMGTSSPWFQRKMIPFTHQTPGDWILLHEFCVPWCGLSPRCF